MLVSRIEHLTHELEKKEAKNNRLLTMSPDTSVQVTITIKLVDWWFYPRPQPALKAIADCLI